MAQHWSTEQTSTVDGILSYLAQTLRQFITLPASIESVACLWLDSALAGMDGAIKDLIINHRTRSHNSAARSKRRKLARHRKASNDLDAAVKTASARKGARVAKTAAAAAATASAAAAAADSPSAAAARPNCNSSTLSTASTVAPPEHVDLFIQALVNICYSGKFKLDKVRG